MRGIERISILLLLTTILMPGLCIASGTGAKTVTHVVIAWLKPEYRTEDYMHKLFEANQRLREIPQVLSLEIGSAIESERKTVDDSFDFGNVMIFNSEQDMKDYLVHPVHTEFVEQYIKGKVEKVVVYDF
ncbi:MAG: Dabb family protein [Gammaproteobacteria bacterium]|jgi:hypothetical protein|nr:Dabb family protein [Gammaproteobacteria bacterium]